MHRVRHHPAIREVISWWVDSLVISQAQWPTSKAKYPVLHFSARHPTEDIALELVVKNLPASTGDIRDAGLIPWSGRSSGGGNGNPLQYCCLENPKDRGAWPATAHEVTKTQTQLKRLNTEALHQKRSSFTYSHGLFFTRLVARTLLTSSKLSAYLIEKIAIFFFSLFLGFKKTNTSYQVSGKSTQGLTDSQIYKGQKDQVNQYSEPGVRWQITADLGFSDENPVQKNGERRGKQSECQPFTHCWAGYCHGE